MMPLVSFERGDHVWWKLCGALSENNRTLDQVQRSLAKATQGGYSTVVLSESSLRHPQWNHIVGLIKQKNFKICLQLLSSSLPKNAIDLPLFAENTIYEIVLDQLPENWQLMQELNDSQRLILTLPGLRSAEIWKKWQWIPKDLYKVLQAYFPQASAGERWSPAQIVTWWKQYPQISTEIKSPQGVDIYDPRIETIQEIEPLHAAILDRRTNAHPKISIVIPAYNNGLYLINTLQHLQKQTLSSDDYEVIVVDDGSSDSTSENLEFFSKITTLSLAVFYFPRLRKRVMGDSMFRAGVARNYGVAHARGEILVFLDADIIVSENFLEETLHLHQSSTVVQWRREYLNDHTVGHEIKYKKVNPELDCFIPEGGYWQQFYLQAKQMGWGELADYWKYVCTYALSMPKDVFIKAGWFRKTYCYYGLEDTDLGWRLSQAGHRFYFHDEAVYHLHHREQRSEFGNSFFRRQKLLKKTAEVFFYNNLSPEIYRVFQYLYKSWWL